MPNPWDNDPVVQDSVPWANDPIVGYSKEQNLQSDLNNMPVTNAITAAPDMAAALIAKGYENVAQLFGSKMKDVPISDYYSVRPFKNAADTVYHHPIDATMSAGSGIVRAVPQFIDTAGALTAKGLNYAGNKMGIAQSVPLSEYTDITPLNDVTTGVLGDEYKPKTFGGDVIKELSATSLSLPTYGKVADVIAGGGNIALKGAKSVGKDISGSFMKGFENPEATAAKQTPAKTSQDFKDLASASYKAADEAGGVLTPDVTNGFIAKAKEVLPQTEAGKLVAGNSEVSDLVGRIEGLSGQPLSLKAAQEIDEHLGDIGYSLTDARGNLTKQGINVLKLQSALRDSISSATEANVVGGKAGFDALQQARGYWSKAMQLGDLERIATRAESMDNPLLSVRTGLRQIVNNPKRMRQFAPAVQDAIKEAAKSGFVGDMLRIASSKLLPIGAAAVGHIPGAVLGEAANLAGKGAQAALGARRLENIAQMVSNGGQAAPGYLERLGASTGRGINALSDGIQNIIGPERAQKIMQLIGSGTKGENLVQGVKDIAGDSADDVANVLRNSGDGELKATFDQFRNGEKITKSPLGSETKTKSTGNGVKLSARPEATAAALGLAGINGANLLSSTLTNTSYDPATPSQMPNGDMQAMGAPTQQQTVQPQEQNTQPTFADKVFQAESKGNPNAKSKTSSAYGAAQFTRGTWLNMVKKYDPITFNSMSKADVLGLRSDPEYAKQMTNSLAAENASHLAGKNVPVNDVSLYLSHFAGPSVTAKVMRARPSAPLSLFFTRDAINANPSILRGKTVSDLIQWAERKMS